jgi:hypothetical protein
MQGIHFLKRIAIDCYSVICKDSTFEQAASGAAQGKCFLFPLKMSSQGKCRMKTRLA